MGVQGCARLSGAGKARPGRTARAKPTPVGGARGARFHELVSAGRTGRPGLGFRGADPDAVRPFES